MIKQDISEMVQQQVAVHTKDFNDKLDKLKSENAQLRENLSKIETKHDELEQYSRRTCVRIGNILEKDGESTDSIVLDVAKTSDADISANDIDRSHRVGKHKPGKRREIIVKFVSYKARTKFLKSRKTLREKNTDIYLNEDLTYTRGDLAYMCVVLTKDKNYVERLAWTFDGRQFIKTDKDVAVKNNNVKNLR